MFLIFDDDVLYFFIMFKETGYFFLEQYDPLDTCDTDSTFYGPLRVLREQRKKLAREE